MLTRRSVALTPLAGDKRCRRRQNVERHTQAYYSEQLAAARVQLAAGAPLVAGAAEALRHTNAGRLREEIAAANCSSGCLQYSASFSAGCSAVASK